VPRIPENPCWYALAVKPRHEKAVAADLRQRGLEEYLPLYGARRSWSDRVKLVELPLFPGYVFCRYGYGERSRVVTAPGVRAVVGFAGADAPVEDSEIAALRTILAAGLPVAPWPYLGAGSRVRIARGPLAGVEGTLAGDKGAWRVVVNVELLRRSVAVEVDREAVAPCGQCRFPLARAS
jgi:transcription antitermination factor NusG